MPLECLNRGDRSVCRMRAIAVYTAVVLRKIIWNATSAYGLSKNISAVCVDPCFRNYHSFCRYEIAARPDRQRDMASVSCVVLVPRIFTINHPAHTPNASHLQRRCVHLRKAVVAAMHNSLQPVGMLLLCLCAFVFGCRCNVLAGKQCIHCRRHDLHQQYRSLWR